MLANVQMMLGDMSDKLEKAKKHRDDYNSNNHDVRKVGAERRVSHHNKVKRHMKADFSDFKEQNDDFRHEGFKAETLG
jgi:hypothetical protein